MYTRPGLCATILLLAAIGPCRSVAQVVPGSGCISVLFVGSLTYVNNLPALYSAVAKSKERCVNAAMVASGGESLREHWETGDVVKTLRLHHWTFVVLQDQTSFGEVYLVNGRSHVHDANNLFIYGGKLVRRIRASGSVPILFLPWASRDMDPRDAELYDGRTKALALSNKSRSSPSATLGSRRQRMTDCLHCIAPTAFTHRHGILSRGRALPCISEQGESRGCRRDHPRECCSFRLRDRQPANQCGACRHRAGIRIAPAKDRVEDKAIRCRHHRTQTDSAYVAGSFNRRPLGYRKFEGRMGRTEFGLSVSSHDAPYKLRKTSFGQGDCGFWGHAGHAYICGPCPTPHAADANVCGSTWPQQRPRPI